MSRRLKIVIMGLLVASLLAVAVTGIALAQEPTLTPKAGCAGNGWGHSFGRWGRGGWSGFDAAAEALGLTPEQLFAELRAGKTLADLAEEQGVDLQAVSDAMAAAKQEARRQAIEQAVQDGRLSREQADWMLQGLDQGWMGHGRGFRFFRWHGGPKTAPPPSSSGTRWFWRPFVVPGRST
ncbi:MAG: hypothetical protein ACE5LU_01795 [Anaerolineae bacterium]